MCLPEAFADTIDIYMHVYNAKTGATFYQPQLRHVIDICIYVRTGCCVSPGNHKLRLRCFRSMISIVINMENHRPRREKDARNSNLNERNEAYLLRGGLSENNWAVDKIKVEEVPPMNENTGA